MTNEYIRALEAIRSIVNSELELPKHRRELTEPRICRDTCLRCRIESLLQKTNLVEKAK